MVCSHRSSHLPGWRTNTLKDTMKPVCPVDAVQPQCIHWDLPAMQNQSPSRDLRCRRVLSTCSFVPSLGPFGRGCCPPLSPATMVCTGFLQLHHCLVAAQVCSSSFPAQVKLKANRSDSKPVSLSFNQHKTFACSLGFKISICPSALWWFCHHPFCVVWALQSPISKTGNLLFLCRQLAFPLVGSIVKQQHPGTKAQSQGQRRFCPKQSAGAAVHPPAFSRTCGALKTH